MSQYASQGAYGGLMEALSGVKPRYSSIPKKWGLRPGRLPQEHPLFSGLALVVVQQEDLAVMQELRCIRFSAAFVEEAGHRLPMGITPDRYGMLVVVKRIGSRLWDVAVAYTTLDHVEVLFRTEERPAVATGRIVHV